ncbi:eukaryotic translation initiation factor 5A-1-like isoform X1 [Pomacea canaliculata]|uniref:eukaryotic translation initiation factor 5A-1-like isoform X1 n=2 Tax=Pomacea canaliculata TaxID=400727 RepID=UPI000D73AEA3|nr:eukaryotic translation initiation factor 5A-1-like isoform X1 [Pomacea canaliculata]
MEKLPITMADEEQFESAESGASKTIPKQCSALRKGDFVCIKNRPCKIVEMSTSKTGKHGHAKVHLVGIDVFTGKKYEDICPSTHNMLSPVVKRTEYTFVDKTDDKFLRLMNDNGEIREDLRCPDEELGKEIDAKIEAGESFLVTVLEAMGEECVVSCKNLSSDK